MENKEILSHLLNPVLDEHTVKWEEFLKVVDDNILWYPSSGNDFSDLKEATYASLYIHTSYKLDQKFYKFLFNKQYLNYKFSHVTVEEAFELKPVNWDWKAIIDYTIFNKKDAVIIASALGDIDIVENFIPQQPRITPVKLIDYLQPVNYQQVYDKVRNMPIAQLIGKVYLLKINMPPYKRWVLYCFIEDTAFLNVFIREFNLKIKKIYQV